MKFPKFIVMNSKILILIFTILCPTYFIRGQARQTLCLDGEWMFVIDSTNSGFDENWQNGISSLSPRKVMVPHTWNIEKGTEEYAGLAWYEKKIKVPKDWKNKTIRLKFGAVYHDAIVYVNGQKVCENLNAGYTPFTADITKFVFFKRDNIIVVAVSNKYSENNLPYQKSFDWTNDGGIIRSVTLEITGKPSLQYTHIDPKINLLDSTGSISVTTKLWEKNINKVTLSFVCKDKATGEIVYSGTEEIKSVKGIFSASLQPGKIKPWHFDSPDLFELETSIITKNGTTDEEISSFGFKEIKVEGEHLFLNGETVRLPGLEYMPGSNPKYGIAEPRSYMDSVVRTMKDLNICITRFHWPQDEYLISLMDQYGILVQEELPWWQKPARLTPELVNTAQKQLNDLVEAHYNHPSIFSWGISNEVNGDTQKEIYLQLGDYVKALDQSRFVTVISNRIWQKKENDETLLFDMPTWNEYIGTWHGKDRNELPQKLTTIKNVIKSRPLLITENGLCEPVFPGGDARRIDDMLFHIKQWENHSYIIGYIYFCLNDYRTHMGEEGFGKYKIRRHGITDVFLHPKPSYSVLKQLASPIEITAVERLTNSTVKVEIKIKNDIPSYTLRGYKLRYINNENESVDIDLPQLKPGNTFSTNLIHINSRFSFQILRPGEFCVIEY